VKILIENEYVFCGFWDVQRSDTNEWRKAFTLIPANSTVSVVK